MKEKNVSDLAPGWIRQSELEFHKKFISNDRGKILEGGAFGGRLFDYLYPFFPNWEYVAVNAWSDEHTYIPSDDNKDYWDDSNIQSAKKRNLMTLHKFKKRCPYAIAIDGYFENFNTNSKFDVVSIGQISKKINWEKQYKHASRLVADNGVIIVRHVKVTDSNHNNSIYQAIQNYETIDVSECGRNIAIKPRR